MDETSILRPNLVASKIMASSTAGIPISHKKRDSKFILASLLVTIGIEIPEVKRQSKASDFFVNEKKFLGTGLHTSPAPSRYLPRSRSPSVKSLQDGTPSVSI